MRIAVFTRALATHSSGGMAIAATNIARCLADSHHEVEVFSTRTETFTGTFDASGVRYFYLADTLPCKYEAGYYDLARAAFEREHAAKPYDAIVSVSKAAMGVLHLPGRPPALFTSHGIGIDSVHEAVNVALIDGSKRGLDAGVLKGIRSTYLEAAPDIHCTEQEFYLKWDALGGVSHSAVLDLQVRMGHPRVFFVPNPVYDVEWGRSVVDRSGAPTPCLGICAGNLTAANKGVAQAVPLLRGLRNVQIHLIGAGGTEIACALGGDADVIVHGKVSQPLALELIANLDMVFDPSVHHSGLNMVVAQAMALGVPVIAYPFGGMPTAIVSGVNGVLIRPGHAADFAAAVECVRSDQLSHAARARAKELFGPIEAGARYTRAIEAMRRGHGASWS